MPKKALTTPYKMPVTRRCRYCNAEVMKRDIVAGVARQIDEQTGICPTCVLRPPPPDVKEAPPPPVVNTEPEEEGRRVAENETFVTMIAVAQEDKAMGDQILAIARLPSFHRESLINSVATSLRLRGNKTASLASAIACLKDDRVAQKTIEALMKG